MLLFFDKEIRRPLFRKKGSSLDKCLIRKILKKQEIVL